MSAWNKQELENMLEDVVNELDLSEFAIEKNGPLATPPAELVRLVLEQKDKEIRMLKMGMRHITVINTEAVDNTLINFELEQRVLVPTETLLEQIKPWLDYRLYFAKIKREVHSIPMYRQEIECQHLIEKSNKEIKSILGIK